MIKFVYPQVATALLVAGSTLSFCILSFKVLGCSYNCMRLTYGSLKLTHVTWWPRCPNDWAMVAKMKMNIITALTTLPQGEFRHVSISAQRWSLRCGQNLRGLFL